VLLSICYVAGRDAQCGGRFGRRATFGLRRHQIQGPGVSISNRTVVLHTIDETERFRMSHRLAECVAFSLPFGAAAPFLSVSPESGPVLSENSIEPSRGSMIVTEEPTKSLAAMDGAVSTRRCEAFWRKQPIVKTLVSPFRVVMRREWGERSAQMVYGA